MSGAAATPPLCAEDLFCDIDDDDDDDDDGKPAAVDREEWLSLAALLIFLAAAALVSVETPSSAIIPFMRTGKIATKTLMQ
mmetsp:Transcript_10586/g.16952  ORF Transcript_10586/g.16952 Transcript_10586/m.16952 type:complete len:81 (-) Transcript_10586:727-969(-)